MSQIQDNSEIIQPIFQKLKDTFSTHKTKCLKFRKAQLRSLLKGLEEMEQEFHIALEKDLGVTMFSSQMTSTIITKVDVENQLAHIDKWSKEESVDTPFVIGPGSSKIIYKPLGVVLVIAAWNYPLYTGIPPMAAAIAAGNCLFLNHQKLLHTSLKLCIARLNKVNNHFSLIYQNYKPLIYLNLKMLIKIRSLDYINLNYIQILIGKINQQIEFITYKAL